MTTPLIEAIKHIRENKSKLDKILVQSVEWDLDTSFFGEPMTPRVLKRLSQYVDKKLIDYSSIQGSEAATNMPRATLSYNEPDPSPEIIGDKKPGVIFPMHTDYVDGDDFDENDFPTEEESIKVYRRHNTSIYGLRVHSNGFNTDGVTIDEPDLFDVSGVNINLESSDDKSYPNISEYDEHRTELEAYIPEKVAAIADEHVTSENTDIEGKPHYSFKAPGSTIFNELEEIAPQHTNALQDQLTEDETDIIDEHVASESKDIEGNPKKYYGTLNGTDLNEIDKTINEAKKPPVDLDVSHEDHCASYYVNSNGQLRDEITEIESECYADAIEADTANSGDVMFQATPNPGLNMGMDIHHDMTFQDTITALRPEGLQVNGIIPTDFRHPAQSPDTHVYSHGALPSVQMRIRDSFIRNRHLTLRLPQINENNGKDFSYVTSYDIEHQTMKVKARIITAPANYKLEDETWFELCCSDGKTNPTLQDKIRSTVKANLCIITNTRGSTFPKMMKDAEKTALETLRDMITEQEYRNYLRYGFITVKGKSGRLYQISRTKSHTIVWENGKVIEEVCIRIKEGTVIPETDNVIAFKVMIETDENLFKSLGNVYNMREKAA